MFDLPLTTDIGVTVKRGQAGNRFHLVAAALPEPTVEGHGKRSTVFTLPPCAIVAGWQHGTVARFDARGRIKFSPFTISPFSDSDCIAVW
jgi:hypothetical protein